MKPKLTLTFDGGWGQQYSVCLDLDEHVATLISRESGPPLPPELGGTMEGGIEKIKTRQFRKELFIDSCANLGQLLSERMEDAEGWHDSSRIEPAKAELRGK